MATVNTYKPSIVFHPGDTLKEKLEEMEIGIEEFAYRTGLGEEDILAVLRGESPVTPEMSVRFETITKIHSDFWLRKQARYDQYKEEGHPPSGSGLPVCRRGNMPDKP